MKKLVVLTGAGISAESGISTFRDSGGLWEQYRIEDVATPEAWAKNPKLVLEFYNQRRKQLLECLPNEAHYNLVKLEHYFDVHIITQNVDDLHERAGSKNILHLHGELRKAQSTADPELIYEIKGWELKWGDYCEKGSQLRPFIVWFGEPVPKIIEAEQITETADIFVVIGTSLQVYPAAGLLQYVKPNVPIYIIDPNDVFSWRKAIHIKEKASIGTRKLLEELIK
ncbi:MAG: NAD-dependent deacylase [Bacteroidales bacterium]|nr:NAD-dependent deacylase [Bacteroidales bacterium]